MNEQNTASTEHAKPYLQIDRLTKKFGDFVALDNVSLEVIEGEFIFFLGPSGCGKTTFMRILDGSPNPLTHFHAAIDFVVVGLCAATLIRNR